MNHAYMKGSHFVEWRAVGWYIVVATLILVGALILFFLARHEVVAMNKMPTVYQSTVTRLFYEKDSAGHYVQIDEPPAPYDHVWIGDAD